MQFLLRLVLSVAFALPAAAQTPAAGQIEVNGAPLTPAGLQTLKQIEAQIGAVPPGRYWYDAMSGGAGVVGGPTSAYLGPGLALGGPLRADASGGGNGRVTGVFINGRELHLLDVAGLRRYGPVVPGRYWWDRYGNVGLEGGPMLFNFFAVAQQAARSGGSSYHRSNASRGESTYVGKGCAAVHGRLRSSDESSSYSYYAGC